MLMPRYANDMLDMLIRVTVCNCYCITFLKNPYHTKYSNEVLLVLFRGTAQMNEFHAVLVNKTGNLAFLGF